MTNHYTLPELGYDHSALEPYLPARIIDLHHTKHHLAYVDGANAAMDRLALARAAHDDAAIVSLEKALAFNVSGHVLHSIYWTNLSPDGGGRPEGDLAAAIAEHFGSFDAFQWQMTRAAVMVQGSGWSALVWDPIGERLLVEQIHDHHGNAVQGVIPLLVIDAWEHAYYLKYENRRVDYVNAIWNVVAWSDVEHRLAAARNRVTAGRR